MKSEESPAERLTNLCDHGDRCVGISCLTHQHIGRVGERRLPPFMAIVSVAINLYFLTKGLTYC